MINSVVVRLLIRSYSVVNSLLFGGRVCAFIAGLFLLLLSNLSFSQEIYWADITNDKIQKVNLDGSSPSEVLISLNNPRGIAIDHIRGHIYYTDDGNNNIVRVDLDGSNSVNLVTSGIATPYGIELDIGRGKMYWSDIGNDVIKRANLDGTNVEAIVQLSSDNPYGIALDLINDKIYWVQNIVDKICRANLDGSYQEDVVTSGLDNPFGIVLDVPNNSMYWTEHSGDRIASAKLDGSNVITLLDNANDGIAAPREIRIDYINEKLVWIDSTTDKIQSCDFDGSNLTDILAIPSTTAYTLQLYEVGAYTKSTLSGNWSSSGTWDHGIPNSSTTDADIASDIIVDGNYTVKDLGIRSGSSLTINSGNSLTVNGNITNNAGASGLVINSDASKTGSLIVSGINSNENVTIERHMTGASTGWHLVGVPVSGQGISDLVTNGGNGVSTNGTKYGLGFYNEHDDTWTTYSTTTAPSSGNLIPGKGYETNRSADGDLSFSGSLSSAQVDISVTRLGNGWNVVGNPYPSALFANFNADASNNFISINSNTLDDSFEAIYLWSAADSEFQIINQSNSATYIPSGQGFFILSKTGGGTISFTPDMRVHQTSTVFKSEELFQSQIILIAEDGINKNTTQIKFIEGCTEGLDPGFDAGMYHGVKSDLALYSTMENQSNFYDLQCFPALSNRDYCIPLEIESKYGQVITFCAVIQNFPEGYSVYLEDRTYANLTSLEDLNSRYSTPVENAITKDRFYLRVSTKDLLSKSFNLKDQELKIITNPDLDLICIEGLYNSTAQIQIYDLSGRLVHAQQIEGNKIKASELIAGVYVLIIMEDGQKRTEKIQWIK